MTPSAGNPHRVGKPLEANEAAARAVQAAVLGDALNLRVLSAIAAGVPASELGDALFVAADRAEQAIRVLKDASLLQSTEDRGWTLTAPAWVRFGRLLVDGAFKTTSASSLGTPVTALPVAVEQVARDLSYRFSATFSAETVSRYVAESYVLLNQRAAVRTHLVALTAKYAADRLDALASAQGLVLRGTPEVLFVCVQNAGRSQLAAAYLRHFAGSAVHVRTAGSAPAGEVHPRIADALAEVGIPPTDDFPKPLTDEVVQAADYVVTMGCGDACPVYPGRRYLDWELQDPLELDDSGLRAVRDEIRQRVESLLRELDLPGQHTSR